MVAPNIYALSLCLLVSLCCLTSSLARPELAEGAARCVAGTSWMEACNLCLCNARLHKFCTMRHCASSRSADPEEADDPGDPIMFRDG